MTPPLKPPGKNSSQTRIVGKDKGATGDGEIIPADNMLSSTSNTAPQAVTLTPEALDQIKNIVDTKVKQSFKSFESTSKVNVNKQFQNLTDQISGLRNEIDTINRNYEEKIAEINTAIESGNLSNGGETALHIAALSQKIDACLETVKAREKCQTVLNYHILYQLGQRSQRDRLWSIRVVNWQSPWQETTMSSKEVYQTLIKPVLDNLKGDADAPSTDFYRVIEYSHPLSQKSGPKSYIFRFFSRRHLYQFMINKKSHVEALCVRAKDKSQWSASAAVQFDPRRTMKISHDLSDLNRNTMTYLHASGIASQTKVSGTGVAFRLKNSGKGGIWIKVLNPFATTYLGLVSPLPAVHDILETEAVIMQYLKSYTNSDNTNNMDFFKGFQADLEALLAVSNKQKSLEMPTEPARPATPQQPNLEAYPVLEQNNVPMASKTAPASGADIPTGMVSTHEAQPAVATRAAAAAAAAAIATSTMKKP